MMNEASKKLVDDLVAKFDTDSNVPRAFSENDVVNWHYAY